MPTRKNGKIEPIRVIEVRTSEISVAKNRFSEPYIKSFVAAPENITQESLGTLVGVFSVSDHSESSGFVVNVLVSAIRKEYFANPRRGVIESFESALHKMNLALSELVKNGQTAWIGNLHGAVAAIEKHSIHFSVTGSGRIILFRGGILSDIGDGLASEEAVLHPLKTFVEISSGRLNPDDCVLLASPEIFDLFSDGELERSARRLIPDQKFSRFLETAMTNELRQGSAIVLTAEERIEETTAVKTSREPRKRTEKTRNVFSAETFKEAAEARAEIFREEPAVITMTEEPESKTRFGDIYVRGEEPENREEHPFITKFRWIGEDLASSLKGLGRRGGATLRQRQEGLSVAISSLIASSISKAKRSMRSAAPSRPTVKKQPDTERETREEPLRPAAAKKRMLPEVHLPEIRMPKIHVPDIPLDRARLLISGIISGTIIPASKSIARSVGISAKTAAREIRKISALLKERFLSLPPKQQIIIASVTAFTLTLGGIFTWNSLTKEEIIPVPIIVTETPTQVFPSTDEPSAVLASPEIAASAQEDIVSLVFLKETLYLVTENGIHDTAKNETRPLPSDGKIRYASSMDDLNLIFVMTEEDRLFAFAPSNRSFVESTLRLPSEFQPAGIGTFLTYLYVLEEGTGRVYRFPRAEGGFGDGLLWTKDPMDPGTRMIAVSENIYGATGNGIQAFLRGKASETFSPETTATPITVTALCANEEAPDRFVVVDAPAKRIVVLGSDGHIVSQQFHESFIDASACSLSRDGGMVAVSIGKDVSLIRSIDR